MPTDTDDNKAGDTATYITREDFSKAMQEQQTRISGAMDHFGDQVSQAILDIRGKPTDKSADTKAGEVRSEAVALIDDPDAYINKAIAKSREQDPELDAIRNDLFSDRIMELEKDFDTEFGDGAFKEQILPDLLKAATDIPSKMRASKGHMRMLYQTIKGSIPADKLVEKRIALKTAQQEAMEKRNAPAMLRGIGVPRGSGDKLDSDESAYLDSLSAKGITYTKDQYLADRKMGSDIDAEVEAIRTKEAKK